jgi:hypothetical protein
MGEHAYPLSVYPLAHPLADTNGPHLVPTPPTADASK